jgi:hypothetical protein
MESYSSCSLGRTGNAEVSAFCTFRSVPFRTVSVRPVRELAICEEHGYFGPIVPNSCYTESVVVVVTVVHLHKFNKSTAVLEKLRISQLLNELPILYEITRFIAQFIRISHWIPT